MAYSREQYREYHRKWRAARRAKFMDGKSCLKCGSTTQLELHHRDPATKTSHKIWSWAEERRNAEIAKCDILCHTCHREETNRQLKREPVHGTRHAYKKYKCRCDACKLAYSKLRKEYWRTAESKRKRAGMAKLADAADLESAA